MDSFMLFKGLGGYLERQIIHIFCVNSNSINQGFKYIGINLNANDYKVSH
jgi:hypothetical protein